MSITIPSRRGPAHQRVLQRYDSSGIVRAASPRARASGGPGRPGFSYGFGPVQAIATSSGQNDAGVFELAPDERYLPFESSGVISRWSIELPPKHNAFDLRTVTDVIMQLTYTAQDAGGRLRELASRSVESRRGTVALLRREFPDAWAAAQVPGATALSLVLTPLTFRSFQPDSDRARFDRSARRQSDHHNYQRRYPRPGQRHARFGPKRQRSITVAIPRTTISGDPLIVMLDYRPPPATEVAVSHPSWSRASRPDHSTIASHAR